MRLSHLRFSESLELGRQQKPLLRTKPRKIKNELDEYAQQKNRVLSYIQRKGAIRLSAKENMANRADLSVLPEQIKKKTSRHTSFRWQRVQKSL